jgi:hypothetical protein
MQRWILALGLLASTTAHAAETVPPKYRLIYNDMVAARNNPIGLMNLIEVMARRRLFKPDGLLLNDTHLSAGPFFDLNPAAAALGGVIRFKPLAVLQLTASSAWVGYFGTFGLIQSFDQPDVDYSDTRLGKNEDAGQNYATTGSILKLEGLIQGKSGPVAFRSTFLASRYDHNARGQPHWFDTGLDVMAPTRGWVLKNDVDLLWMDDKGLALGGRWTWTDPILGTQTDADRATHRAGPIGIYKFFDRPGASYNAPSVVFMAQWYARHPYRTGQDVPAALPYVAGGFLFGGDIIPW